MNKNLFVLLFFICVLQANGRLHGQRYEQEVFAQTKLTDAVYGSNFTIPTLLEHTVRQPLNMRVYEPVGDTSTNRPLVIYLHTGKFLPFPQNAGCFGSINDSSCVEIASRLARMGYVVAVVSYRLGWNPLATTELARRFSFINANYRGMQDVRTCVRYFRKSVIEEGNPWGVNPENIVVWGQGTGAYLALAAATLNEYSDLVNTSEPGKFMITPNLPMIIQTYNGDIYGNPPAPVKACLVDSFYHAITGFPIGDTLCVPNHEGYSSAFAVTVNMGGALLDQNWLDTLVPPIVSFHVVNDPFTPCYDGGLGIVLPPSFNFILNVTGSCRMHEWIESSYHTNDLLKLQDDCAQNGYVQHADAINGGRAGFYPFLGVTSNSSEPWEWADSPPASISCNTDATIARMYVDTIIGYAAPMLCRALQICCVVNTKTPPSSDNYLDIAPNPSSDEVRFSTLNEYKIQDLELYDMNGRMIRSVRGINHSSAIVDRGNLPNGIYTAKIYFNEGVMARMIVFE